MEKANKRIRRGRKSPKVPIETYKWEDVRRSRRRGGYPWTHLYKEPLYEHLDPEPWTMEGMRKAKSSSTMGKSDDFSISEVTTFDNRSAVEEVLDDPSVDIKDMTHSMKTSCSSLNLEEQEIDDDIERAYEVIDKEETAQTPGMFFLNSEESSDDISQYLDKEERLPSQDSKASQDQLKPENEMSAKKRKLSAESSNSKLSLGKKAFIQKLKGTTEKIKAPKLTFPTKLKKPIPKKTKNSPPQIKKPTQSSTATSSNTKPVYIHIPLKPPPGETDQYSHLENEPLEKEAATRKPASFRDLVKTIKHLQEPPIEHKHPSPIRELKEEEPEDSHNKELVDVTVKMLVAEEHVFDIEKKEIPEESTITNGNCKATDEVTTQIDTPEDVTEDTSSPVIEAPDEDYFNKLFEASTSRERTNSQKENRNVRSKSAEPERKRKASLESSYSRKSLSKLGFLKKLRDAKDKLKSSLSRTTSKKDVKAKDTPKSNEKTKEKDIVDKPKEQLKPKKHVEPVYIHIPLRPPEGETDQFSHLKYEAPATVVPKEPESKSESDPECSINTPDVAPDVQLIILTAPSDDEILDYNSSDVPETPVSENKPFFPLKVHELKKIAKDAINEVTNGATSNKLASVAEENGKNSHEEQIITELEEDKKVEHMTIDEEDGLSEAKKDEIVVEGTEDAGIKEEIKIVEQELTITDDTIDNASKVSESASCNEDIDKPEEVVKTVTEEKSIIEDKPELKSVLKAPNSPVMKKKVSFKRKSKSKSSEEETDKPEAKEVITVTEDGTDLKDDEKHKEKWSETNDHEPEHLQPPLNTELQTINLNNTPAVVISTEEAMGLSDQDNYNLSAKHVYEEISEDTHKKPLKTQKVAFSATSDSRSSETSEKKPAPKEARGKFQAAFKQKASNFKTKLQSIKKPHITLPERPKFQKPNLQRFKIEKPKWSMPKMPDTAKISLPHFSLPRKGAKKPAKRISSTESTSGGSKKITFDFGTYPRIFKRKSKPDVAPQFATVPRAKKTDSSKSTEDSRRSATDSIRIPLHSEDSTDKDELNSRVESSDLIEPSHIRYSEGIDSEDEYERETKEVMEERDFLSRWQRGRFNPDEFGDERRQPRVTDLDSPTEDKEFSSNNGKEPNYSSSSSVAVHRQGVLEEINPDEFFLRQKGISQDNIEVGMYLSTEIREAFRNPTNALVQMEENNFNKGSHHSLPELQNKRKPIKKPKRKKTPHASQERIQYGEESADEETDAIPPSRPKRRSKKKKKTNEEFIPYQETIQVDLTQDERLTQHRESLGILADDEQDFTYENEAMEGIEQPEIRITDPYKNYGEDEIEEIEDDVENDENEPEEDLYVPEAPPRLKPKSIKSLKTFEMGSAIRTFEVVSTIPKNKKVPERISYHTKEKEVNEYPQISSHELNITEPEMSRENFNNYRYLDESIEDLPPPAPPRKHKSVKSLTISENESLPGDLVANRMVFSSEKTLEEPQIDAIRTESKIIIPIEPEIQPPIRPLRSRSRGNSNSRTGSRAASETRTIPQEDNNSVCQEEDLPVPCIEEPCTQTICDYMGYTTVDRNKPRDPPLPPPRSLQRKKKPKRTQENNFFTIPRTRSQVENDTPVRPSRIYSTILPNHKADAENKENLDIDILQYIEQDSNSSSRNLQSGEVIEKIKVRPLPTPPRPPRKLKPLADITSRENIAVDSTEDIKKSTAGESEVYTQTEPLPEDFVCEEVVQEPTDRVIIPSQTAEGRRVKRELITPTMFTHEETVTHGSLIVEPLNGARILPDSDFSEIRKEKIIPVHVESDNEETSSIPDEFHKLSDPVVENKPLNTNEDGKEAKKSAVNEMDVLKANKLQVIDLDVDTLTVNRLLAGKIVVSEIDSNSIQTNEISSKTGSSKVADISLPPEVLEQIVKSIRSNYSPEEQEKPQSENIEQKKTPIEPSPSREPTIEPCPEEAFEISTNQNVEEPVTSEEERISDTSHPETVPLEEPKEVPSVFSEPAVMSHTEEQEIPLLTNPESTEAAEEPPHRPPRQSERLKASQSTTEVSMQEPEVDDEPPPRPPHLPLGYMPSQPPVSFYALRAQKYVEDNIPAVPRRRRPARAKHPARSSSEDSSDGSPVARRLHRHASEPTVAQLTGQLARACASQANSALKRLINYILNNVFHNEDGKQDLNVMIIIILVLIAGLLLLGYGEERTVIHLHHWEYFNPPKDL
ncbi:unnamed protein product [Phyllotreta striolata]|uniref:Uncharacterized protein n=1 Tax=Phyllotreta striolata TaxID=444603 RepID=A0A9N9TPQ9_PHYSR|nr:unnamed protein product [Phyllotreta striolata]